MKTQFAKIALATLGLAITLFLSCTDNQPLEFPSLEEVRQKLSSSEPSSSSAASNLCAEEDKCNGLCYNKEIQFCDNKTIYDKCSGNSYNVQSQICCGNAPYPISSYGCCDETSYLLSGYGCKDGTVLTKCGQNLYNPQEQFCASNGSVNYLCGGKQFDPPEEYCDRDGNREVIKGTCGGISINYDNQFCYDKKPYDLCGGRNYDPTTQFCSGNTVRDKCGDNDYDPAEEFCYSGEPYPLCGDYDYNPTNQFCYGTTIKGKCGGTLIYDPSTHYCHTDGQTYSCGNKPYNPSIYYCHTDGQTYSCNNKPYDPSIYYCHTDGKTYSCGNKPYNPATHYCNTANGQTYSCGSKPYNPANQFCYETSKIGDFCGINPQKSYDPDLYECKPESDGIYLKEGVTDGDGNKYNAVLIGTQVWMAKNLKYKVDGSKCVNDNGSVSDNNTARCDTHGRLYSWTMAITVCPIGWHLPSYEELNALTSFINPACDNPVPNTQPGGGGIINCTDVSIENYGFATLLGGYLGNAGQGWVGDFGSIGRWWTLTENNTSNAKAAYFWEMIKLNEIAIKSDWDNKLQQYSVRCVQD